MKKHLKKDIIQWDIKAWAKVLKYWDKNVDWTTVQKGLELGGREGGLSLWTALKGKEMVCSDIVDVKTTAEPFHKRYNVDGLVVYEVIDATNIPYENHFDVILFKSIMGGVGFNDNIENQKKAFKEIYKALKPGGKLLFAENLKASSMHQYLRKKYIRWGNSWRYVTLPEMDEFLSDFSSYEIKTTGFFSTLGRNEKQRTFLATIDQIFLLNKILPSSWKYISYGVAVK